MKKLFNDEDIVWVVSPSANVTFECFYKTAQRERVRLNKKYNAVFAIVRAGASDDEQMDAVMKIHDRNIAKCTKAVEKLEAKPVPKVSGVAKGFTKYVGTYDCPVCKRKTRETDPDAAGAGLCAQCYELGGIENSIHDGYETAESTREEALKLMREIAKKGGKVDSWDYWTLEEGK